jgi:hypothetical protein
MTDALMRMWGKLFLKRIQPGWSCTLIDREIYDFLGQEENFVLNVVQYLYVGMDWRGRPNILFTTDEPLDDRGNIFIMF